MLRLTQMSIINLRKRHPMHCMSTIFFYSTTILNFITICINTKNLPKIRTGKKCAQTVPKICQKYRNICKNIEIYRNPNDLKNQLLTGVTPYNFCFLFFLCCLHTVEVTGSNPVSLTTFSNTRVPPLFFLALCDLSLSIFSLLLMLSISAKWREIYTFRDISQLPYLILFYGIDILFSNDNKGRIIHEMSQVPA